MERSHQLERSHAPSSLDDSIIPPRIARRPKERLLTAQEKDIGEHRQWEGCLGRVDGRDTRRGLDEIGKRSSNQRPAEGRRRLGISETVDILLRPASPKYKR